MAYIAQSSIQEVTGRLDAVAVISDYLHLEKRSGRYWACCPFHQEKTASFTVNPDLKTYYCFGCHKGGSIIGFIMEMDKLSFPEAIEFLAKRFGVELVYEKSAGDNSSTEEDGKKKRKEELYELYFRISSTFHHFLVNKPEFEHVKRYIILRGISNEMIERFRLGYAPADRYWLHKFLGKKGYSDEFLASSGLFSPRHKEVSLFSGRMMFPINDRQGRTVAFGGRYMEDANKENREAPKYINSPELEIYKKGETLYAVDLALKEIKATKTVYIAEGYIDVIALHQAGITNAVAPLGTAFTDGQAKLLQRWAEKAVIFFDTDKAGRTATEKAIYTCLKSRLACAVVLPPEEGTVKGKDPAEILQTCGPEALQKAAKCFITDFDYLVLSARSLYDTTGSSGASAQGKARAVASLFPYFDLLDSEVTRGACIEAAADSFGLLPPVVENDYRRYIDRRQPAEYPAVRKEEANSQLSGRTGSPVRMNEELLLLIVVAVDYVSVQKEKLFAKFRTALEVNEVDDPNAKEIFIALEECLRYGETGMDELLGRIDSAQLKELIMERSASGEFAINPGKYVADGIKKIKRKGLEIKQEEIIIKLRSLKNNAEFGDQDSQANAHEIKELLAEKMKIDNDLYLLKQGK